MSIGIKACAEGSHGDGAAKKVKNTKGRRMRTKISMWMIASKRIIICLPKPDSVRCRQCTTCSNSSEAMVCKTKVQCEFSSWLQDRGEHDVSTAITIGMSPHGRALFASRPIHSGECILQVSRDLMITPDKLPDEVTQLLAKDVSDWARLALFILAHKHAGQASPWAPYIHCLPSLGGIHSTIFWRKEELAYLNQSPVHRETMQRRAVIHMEYSAVQNALKLCPNVFGDKVCFEDFKHAYATVCSRAWGIESLSTLALVPFVDFFNHDPNCRSLLSYDEDRNCGEVIADRDYTAGEQVIISYGQLPNATLALDFGFSVPFNPYDQAEIWMEISKRDPLREKKLQLLCSHNMDTLLNEDGSETAGNSFILQEVKSATGRGKGISQAARAFARVICASSLQELEEMGETASATDGRLARRPFSDKIKESHAMTLLLTQIEQQIERHVAAVEVLQEATVLMTPRKEIAEAVLSGELRVLRSATVWLTEHIKTLCMV